MKRLTLFATALLVAVSSFAAVSYELNGGVTNDFGWTTPQDMYATLNADWNAFSGTSTTWKTLDQIKGDAAAGIPTQAGTLDAPFLQDANFKLHFDWLLTYMDAKCTEAGAALASTGAAALRYNLGAFFADAHRTSWPVGPSYISHGVSHYDAYAATWKGAFANPTEPTDSFKLNEPYKADATFEGWYANAEFTGDKITHVDAKTTGTLYAKWGAYIPTIAEVLALEDGTATAVRGIVTYVDGSQLWIQDHSGAINLYHKNNGAKIADKIILKGGKKSTYNGTPQVSDATEIIIEEGEAIIPAILSTKVVTENLNKYLSHFVTVPGLKATWSGDSLFFKENDIKVFIYKHSFTKADLPENQKLDANVIVCQFKGAPNFRVTADNITKTGLPGKDNYAYPARGEEGQYTLTNKWLFSNTLDNFQSNKPNGQALYVRGMVENGGMMYFCDREFDRLVVVDAETGIMQDPIALPKNLWTKPGKTEAGVDTIVAAAVTLKNNDIKCDDAGNLLLGPCTMNSGDFQVWKFDPKTGEGELVIHETLWADKENKDSMKWRIDAFDVYGDVDGSAIIMATNADAMNVFKWTIEDGKQVGASEVIDLYVDASETSYLIQDGAMIASPGTAPQTYIVGEEYFYIDGFSTLPTLFDMSGTLADDFKNCPLGLKVGNLDGDTTTVQTQQNGLIEFQVGDEYFLLITAAGTTAGNNFALYKYADEARSWADMTPMWYFPAAGMGSASNGGRTAVPSVTVDQKAGIAKLYLYACENGYGMYEFQGVPAKDNAVENVLDNTVKAQKVLRDGQVIIIRNGVEYNVLGSQL